MATEKLDLLRDHWREAVRSLDIEFQAPFFLDSPSGERLEFACLLPQFGSPKGQLVCLMSDRPAGRVGSAAGFAVSSMGAWAGMPFDLASIMECLVDWGWAVEGEPPPAWYTKVSDNRVEQSLL
jgi:hypothetical protein